MQNEVIFSVDQQNVAYINLNRPDYHNAMNQPMLIQLIEHFKTIHSSITIKAVILRGNGKSFCAGADLSHMKKIAAFSEAENIDDAMYLSDMLELLNTIPCPTIAFAHGAVMGGGLGLLSACDIVIVEENTNFAFSEVKLGIIPAMISPYVVKAIGFRHARRYFLTGERFNTDEALRIGLAHQSCTHEQINDIIETILSTILKNGSNAVQQAKKLLQQLSGEIEEDTRLQLAKLLATLRASDEGQELLADFLNKSK